MANKSPWQKPIVLLVIALLLSIFLFANANHSFQADSEELVASPLSAVRNGIEFNDEGYGLGIIQSLDAPDNDDNSLADYHFFVYKSQVGLQGFIFRTVARFVPRIAKIYVFRMACCFCLAVVIMAIVYQLSIKYGWLFALTFGTVTMISPWVTDFSINLYWVEFIWYVPMLLGLLCLNYKNIRKFIYPLFFVAIFIKCLCGYEYLSTIMMTGIMFLLVEWVCNKNERKDILKTVFIVGVFSVAGFLAAYLIHANIYGSGNIIDGIRMLKHDLVDRRCFGNASDFDPAYTASLEASVFDVLAKYFWKAGNPIDGVVMALIGITATAALVYQRIILKKENNFEICLFVIALMSTISWLVLGKAHSYLHTHLNFVLFYMGWVQSCVYIILKTVLEKTGYSIKLVRDSK